MIDTLKPLIKKFLPFAQEKMGFDKPPRLFLKGDKNNASDPLGKTAYYDPEQKSVTIYITGRHPKDVMRSLSHELVHHSQNCRGDFDGVSEMGEGYAQKDSHLREMEREAYEVGNMCFRDWEDSLKSTIYFEHLQKGDKKMSIKDWKNKEMSGLLAEAWGFKFNTLQEFEKFDGTGEIQEVSDQEGEKDGEEETRGDATDTWEKEGLKETGAKDTGASKGDDSKTHKGEKDYTTKKGDKLKTSGKGRGEKKGDEAYVNEGDTGASKGDDSKTHPGEKDYTTKKGDELKHSGKGRGEKKGDKAYVNEDTGEEEGHHYDDNRMSDDDHIKAIEHHLDALRHDRDYDDDHIDEMAAKRQGNEDRDVGRDRMHADRMHEDSKMTKEDIREALRRVLSTISK